jgi:DNA polymerase II
MDVRQVEAFLLSREWRDADDGLEVTLWARAAEAPVKIRLPRQEAVMFVARDTNAFAHRRVPRELVTLDGAPVREGVRRRRARSAPRRSLSDLRGRREALRPLRDGAFRHRRSLRRRAVS